MPKSMTGYGKLDYVDENYRISCEIKTVNSKVLDVSVSLPYYLSGKENLATSIVSKYVKRGKVHVKINTRFLKPVELKIDFAMARSYFEVLESIRESLNIQSSINLSDILVFREIFHSELDSDEIERLWNKVVKVLENTLEVVDKERQIEGEKLSKDLKKLVDKLMDISNEIEKYSHLLKQEIAKRIKENVEEILPENVELDANQFETAVALIADKADIREEIVRLKSHLNRCKELLNQNNPVGTLLNFLSQEIHRELNTILSKSRMLEISNLAIDGKFVNSQIKEQVQNIE
ncbi:YicC family protein [Thermosipho ferrireducens]|uniref:YicC family protein n=1 Tax=Thermosipho ferrireducens TaxID=2571116 RepID=A0ABX7S5H7_9BACT|nr:YicC/YloC family endoribonuclease [Thermosipho ferrireducens]QTA37796.1 YicC family protein [Thermosipho ferrireducens]